MVTRADLLGAIQGPSKVSSMWSPMKPGQPDGVTPKLIGPLPPVVPQQPQAQPAQIPAPMPMPVSGDQLPSENMTPDLKQFNTGAGAKAYGGGRPAPNMGATPNKAGYQKRDAKRTAISRRG